MSTPAAILLSTGSAILAAVHMVPGDHWVANVIGATIVVLGLLQLGGD